VTAPNQDPSDAPGLQRGGGVAPGDTPPVSGSMSESLGTEDQPNVGPVSGNRTPMIITLVVLAVIVVMVAVFTVASLVQT
jgi:hypothetical protein